jgi:hypothetical protein
MSSVGSKFTTVVMQFQFNTAKNYQELTRCINVRPRRNERSLISVQRVYFMSDIIVTCPGFHDE